VDDRRGYILLFLIMALLAFAVGGIAIGSLYSASVGTARAQLAAAARLQAETIAAALASADAARADALANGAAIDAQVIRPAPATVGKLYRDLGPDGRLRVVERRDGGLVVWWPLRPAPDQGPRTVSADAAEPGVSADGAGPSVSPDTAEAATLERALSGGATTAVVTEGGHAPVVAAFHTIRPGTLGVVADVDVAAIRAPFVGTATVLAGAGLFLIILGSAAFFGVTHPMARRIREGEVRFRGLFNNMRTGAIVIEPGPDGNAFIIRGVNRRAERLDAIDGDSAVGRNLFDVLPALQNTPVIDAVRQVLRTGRPEHVAVSFHRDERVAEWREHYVYRLPSGEVVVVYDDVSERQRAQEALKESEARWRSIIEMQTVAIIVIDQKHDIRYLNKAAEAMFGQSSQELVGSPFGFPVVQRKIAEIEIPRPGKGLVYAEMRAIPMRWSGQDNTLLFLQDVSAHKRAEGDLRKLFQAIEQSPVSVVITDVDGNIEYVNPKFTDATGYTYAEAAGKTPRVLKSGEAPPEAYAGLWRTIKAGQVWRGEFHNRKKNGELFWELASIAPVRDPSGRITHFVAVKEDITERKATEERLRLSQRLEVIGQLTGGLAHDFNNLLAIIVGNLQLIEEHIQGNHECEELVADAIWSAERGAQLTHRLLAFARRQRLNPALTDVNHVVGEMTDLLRRTLGEQIQVQEVLSPGLWKTMIDRGQLENALLNLVVNARDAMPDGGVLTIATGNIELPAEDEAKTDTIAHGRYVKLAVSDTGSGMAPDVLERIFEPFFTTKRFGQGSGLGLSMVYGFVRQSGGEIVVTSEAGSGTTVKIFLPRVDETAVDAAAGASPAATGVSGGGTILVVEDDARVRSTTARVLARHGYTILEAEDSAAALAILADRRVDLLFADVVLPNGLDGVALAHQVVARWPHTRVLLTSGYAAEAAIEGTERVPESRFELLPKPYPRDALLAKVRDAIDRAS
jgi:PAS domain S-box-containing protein